MIYQIDIDSPTRDYLRQLHPLRKQRIKEALRSLAQNPLSGKALIEEFKDYHSYRVGNFRIIYSINDSKKILHLVAIGPRASIYETLKIDLLTYKKKNP